MKIGIKLGISYAVLLIFICIISLNSISEYNKFDKILTDLAFNKFPTYTWVNSISEQLNETARTVRNLALLDPSEIDKIKAEKARTANNSKVISAAFDSLSQVITTTDGIERLNRVKQNRAPYLEARTHLIQLLDDGKKDEAVKYLMTDMREIQNSYINELKSLNSYIRGLAENAALEGVKDAAASIQMLYIMSGIILLLTILMAMFITRIITKPIGRAVDAADNISKGNLNVDLSASGKDETAILLGAMQKMKDNIQLLVDDTKYLSQAAVDGKLDTRADSNKHQGEFKAIVVGVNGTLDAVIGPLNVAAEYMDRISKGDIPPRIIDEYRGDFNEIKNNLNTCIDAIQLLVKDSFMLSDAAIQGKLDKRADAMKHGGDFRKIVEGVNKTLDNVIGPLNVAAEYVDRIAKGDIPPKIVDEYKGDFNEIKNNLNQCIDAVKLLVQDSISLSNAAVDGKLDTRADASKHQGDFRKIIDGVNKTLDNVIGPLNVAAEYVDRIAKGDIPPKIVDNYKGDFNEIKNNLNQCIDAVRLLVQDTNMLVSSAIEGKLSTRADAMRHQGDFRKIVQGVNDTLDSVINPLNVAADFIDKVSRGEDLEKITDEYKGDFNVIKKNINVSIDVLYGLIAEVQRLTGAAIEGKLDTRADISIYKGGWSIIVGGINKVLDAVIGPLNVSAEYMDRISKGDIPPRIVDEYKGDFNEIKNNLNTCIDAVKLLVQDANALAEAAVKGELVTRAEANRHQGDFRKIVEGVNKTLDAVIAPINEAGEVLGILATGDMTVRMNGNYHGDLEKLKSDINVLADSLSSLITEVTEAVQNSASSAMEISATAESLAAATQEQSAQADEVASAVEEMSRTVTENALSANKTSEMAQLNGKVASEGGIVVSQTVTKMRDIADVVKKSAEKIETLGDSSKQIGEIISVIDDIADQTNLLALNAAIEAARAGEQGRGFAVVADEVRKLAERTTEATKQIASMIKGIQQETESAVVEMNKGTEEVRSGIELADKAGVSLQQILTSTQEVLDMINQIAAASEEQSATSEQISKNVTSISKVTSESAHRVEDVARTADELAKMTDNLNRLMSKFKVDDQIRSSSMKSLSRKSAKHLSSGF